MHRFILLLAMASVLVISAGAASAQLPRTGASSIDRHPQTRPPKLPEEVMAGLSTAERAQKLREANETTRKAFAVYQAEVAEARRDGDPTDAAANEVLGLQARTATREQIARFGEDSDERARQLQNIGRATRRAFDKFQAALWREQDLAEAAGAEARIAAFGADTPAPAPVDGQAATAPPAPANAMAQEPPQSGDGDD